MTLLRTAVLALCASLAVAGCGRPDRSDSATGTAPSEEGGKAKRVVLQNKGSDTLVNVAQAWAEAYRTVDPNVAVAVTGGGSGTGISAMINGTVDIASSSRKMKDKEIDAATANGHTPVEHIVGYDALAVFLHPSNPISSMTIQQLAAIYGENGDVDTWSALGIKIEGCPSDEIVRVSRQNNSGTFAYFKEAVLGEGRDYKMGSRDMHGSKDVEMPCISKAEGEACVVPTSDTALDGSYPIARPLFMYTAGEPQGATKAYLDWIMSDAGQCIIAAKGYAPIKAVTPCP
jgi:phosphate transport system substrate-binding protein